MAAVLNQLPKRPAAGAAILDEFARASGLTSSEPARRYLWTDAFAVYTWLGLHQTSGEARFLGLAERLIDQVHRILGKHPSASWLSGLDEAQGAKHPTAGGLRIGKRLPERVPNEPYDPELEWDRDGQYYHYLTRWMRALERAARVTGDEHYRRWAAELAAAAHRGFSHPGGLYWKMSFDLSRPLVPSMGMHDPLDGLVITAALGLERESAELARLCANRGWATDDPLGAGGLLLDALALARLVAAGRKEFVPLFAQVLDDAAASLEAVARTHFARLPATRRLAFRELGLALGLHALERLGEYADIEHLEGFVPLAKALEDFWLAPANQAADTWTEHGDINAVTLAACLAPEGSLL